MEPREADAAPTDSRAMGEPSGTERVASLVQSLQASLSGAGESERYRVLADLLAGWAETARASGNGRPAADREKALLRRTQDLEKLKADLEDTLRATRADLVMHQKQLDAERECARELQSTLEGQRARLESAQRELSAVEAQLVQLNGELHAAQTEKERLLLQLQRTQLQSGDHGQTDALVENARRLNAEVDSLRAEIGQLRQDKNAEIERLKAQIRAAGAGSTMQADALLARLWDRLASARPPLATGGLQPTPQAAERLVDAFIELAAFVSKFDQDMRLFLNKYTKHHPSVSKPWKVYAEHEDFHQIIGQTVEPTGNRNVGILKMKLKVCQKWAFAAMVSGDSIVESLAAELQSHLMGQAGAGADPRCTVRDYLKNNGPDLFLEHVLKLRSGKLAEVYGLGV